MWLCDWRTIHAAFLIVFLLRGAPSSKACRCRIDIFLCCKTVLNCKIAEHLVSAEALYYSKKASAGITASSRSSTQSLLLTALPSHNHHRHLHHHFLFILDSIMPATLLWICQLKYATFPHDCVLLCCLNWICCSQAFLCIVNKKKRRQKGKNEVEVVSLLTGQPAIFQHCSQQRKAARVICIYKGLPYTPWVWLNHSFSPPYNRSTNWGLWVRAWRDDGKYINLSLVIRRG